MLSSSFKRNKTFQAIQFRPINLVLVFIEYQGAWLLFMNSHYIPIEGQDINFSVDLFADNMRH